jgi:hypothetical protein
VVRLVRAVLLKRQEHIRRDSKSMEQDKPGGEDGGQLANAACVRVRRERLRTTIITRRFW